MAERKKNELPEDIKSKGHVMAEKYKYCNFDEQSGLWKPNGGDFIIVRPYATFAMSAYFNPEVDPFPRLEEVTMEKGDFLLITPQKTGTHFVCEVMRMLLRGSAEYWKEAKDVSWIEIQPYDKIVEATKHPRILNTHLAPSWIPPKFVRADTKIVITMRNIKDTFVSYFHHGYITTPMESRGDKNKRWGEYFRWLLHSKTVTWASFFEILGDIWDNHRSNPNVLIVFYEQLKRNTESTIEGIAKHMGVPYSPKLIDEITKACDINKMRSAKMESEAEGRKEYGEGYTLYRKGEIGDWKNWFTVAQNEEFHRYFDEWNRERQIPFIFE